MRPDRPGAARLVPRPGDRSPVRPRTATRSASITAREEQTGNVKQVWEISRLQHLTLLATAWYLTGDERLRAAGRRSAALLVAGESVPVRRELDERHRARHPPDQPGLDQAPAGRLAGRGRPVRAQRARACSRSGGTSSTSPRSRSRGSSANNHVIAEAAGQLVASCAFPWFRESERWRRKSAAAARARAGRATPSRRVSTGSWPRTTSASSPSSGLLAAVEAEASGHPLSAATWERLCAMVDSAAALVDEQLRPPRQGDSDEGRALLLDAPAPTAGRRCWRWADALFGRLDWWPRPPPDAGSSLIGALAGATHPVGGRPTPAAIPVRRRRDDPAADRRAERPEIWCRCDGGPHGYLSIAAHAHADALSIEVRYAGVDILADPGTYCYHGEPAWRSYFRSTIAHNTVELGGRSQSSRGRPVPLGCVMRRPGRSRSSMTVTSPAGRPNTTATPRSTHRRGIAARSCWTGPRAASISSTRSTAAATRSDWPSTSGPRYRRNSTDPARS